MKTALVHDYLTRLGGAERVLSSLHQIFPNAPIYTLLYDKKRMECYFPQAEIRTSFLQKFPSTLKTHYKYLLPLFPVAVETFDLREFDLVISSSSAFAKGVITRPNTTHICYCHSPMRFVWDWYHSYLKEQRRGLFLNTLVRLETNYLRIWDRNASSRVNYFIANSKITQRRIWKYYRRKAKVIYPPVETTRPVRNRRFSNGARKCAKTMETARKCANPSTDGDEPTYVGAPDTSKEYFLIVSRLTPYKKIDLAVESFNRLELPLVIIGEGPERKRLESKAKDNIKFLGWQPEEELTRYYENCLAFVFPGEEDFGITAVEAMAAGKPVLAYRKGGVAESVLEGVTGEFFDDPIPEVLADGVRRLLENIPHYDPLVIRERAEKFSKERFEKELIAFVERVCYSDYGT